MYLSSDLSAVDCRLTGLWKSFGVLAFIFSVSGLVPCELGCESCAGSAGYCAGKGELPVAGGLKILWAE